MTSYKSAPDWIEASMFDFWDYRHSSIPDLFQRASQILKDDSIKDERQKILLFEQTFQGTKIGLKLQMKIKNTITKITS